MKTCPICKQASLPDALPSCYKCGHVFSKPIPPRLVALAATIIIATVLTATGAAIDLGRRLLQAIGTSSSLQSSSQSGLPIVTTTSSASGATHSPILSVPGAVHAPSPTNTPSHASTSPSGKIVFTCQLFKDENRNQVCIMNADGSGWRRLTQDDQTNSFYPSLSPDGKSIVYSSSRSGKHEIYQMDLNGNSTRLTSLGEAYSPEISPDGSQIVFVNANGVFSSLWIMNRDGANAHELFRADEDDCIGPSWSPDGQRILFEIGAGDRRRLYTIRPDGSNPHALGTSLRTGGRSDWSPLGDTIATFAGTTWDHALFTLDAAGTDASPLYSEGNPKAPSYSPDGLWVAFTAYLDHMHDDNGCEIYVLKVVDKELRRLTDNNYCDWQPRWGP